MRRSGAGGIGGSPPPDSASAPPESPAPGDGVTACPLASLPSIWLVCYRGEMLPMGRFDGAGAAARAAAYAEQVRGEIRAGTFGQRRPKGACSLGHPCDRDRVHGFLRDLPDHVLAKLALCAEHQEQARPGSQPPPPPSPSPSPGAGRRRKAVPS